MRNPEEEQNMKCPYCSNPDTKVIDSRPAEDGNRFEEEEPVMSAGKDLLHMRRLRRFL